MYQKLLDEILNWEIVDGRTEDRIILELKMDPAFYCFADV